MADMSSVTDTAGGDYLRFAPYNSILPYNHTFALLKSLVFSGTVFDMY